MNRWTRAAWVFFGFGVIAILCVRLEVISPSRSPDGIGLVRLVLAPGYLDTMDALSTLLVALFAGLTYWVGNLQRQTLEATLDVTREVERSYVVISHRPPGLSIGQHPRIVGDSPPPEWLRDISLTVSIRNIGRTPAQVTATCLQFLITDQPLPPDPPYDLSRTSSAEIFLGAGQKTQIFMNISLQDRSVDDILHGRLSLYAIGYVDYLDKFGTSHRHGYARNFYRTASVNNLRFVTQVGYNYDRRLH